MENNPNMNIDNSQVDFPDLKKDIEKKKNEMEEMLKDLGENSKENNLINDLFYKSVKMIFDMGFELANNLNLELLDTFKKEKENE
ncbi:MAG: hypothetical protein ACFFAN_12990 [Promethearchaeota archaeon]